MPNVLPRLPSFLGTAAPGVRTAGRGGRDGRKEGGRGVSVAPLGRPHPDPATRGLGGWTWGGASAALARGRRRSFHGPSAAAGLLRRGAAEGGTGRGADSRWGAPARGRGGRQAPRRGNSLRPETLGGRTRTLWGARRAWNHRARGRGGLVAGPEPLWGASAPGSARAPWSHPARPARGARSPARDRGPLGLCGVWPVEGSLAGGWG